MDRSDVFQTADRVHLGERAKQILIMRYMHDMTLDQIAQALGITRERVRQIESKAILEINKRQDLKDRAQSALNIDK